MNPSDGFATAYTIDLLLPKPVELDPRRLTEVVMERLSASSVSIEGTDLRVTHSGFEKSPHSNMAPSTLISLLPATVNSAEIQGALQQSSSWDEARDVASKATHFLRVQDLSADHLPYKKRLGLFQSFLAALLSAIPTTAIHWRESQQIVDPLQFDAAYEHEGELTTRGALNVRLATITRADDGSPLDDPEFVMDTLGLSALGLDDLQCHFFGLPPEAVGHHLYETALYLFDNGPIIRGGHKIRGLTNDERWLCEMEDSILDPARVVIDLNPGPAHTRRS